MQKPSLTVITWVCAAVLTVAAVAVSLILLDRHAQAGQTAAVTVASPLPTEEPPTPSAMPTPSAAPAPSAAPTPARAETAPPAPPAETPAEPEDTPYITPPAEAVAPASGSDVILSPVTPATDGDLDAPPAGS